MKNVNYTIVNINKPEDQIRKAHLLNKETIVKKEPVKYNRKNIPFKKC